MKDAKGHGSDSHSDGINQVGQPVNMQRRQYEAIAGAISRVPATIPNAVNTYMGAPDTKTELARHFGEALMNTNPNFNYGKFVTAATTGNMGRTKNADSGLQARHYRAIADTIGSLPSPMRGPVAQHFAGELSRGSSKFDSQRFIKAAGG